MEQYDQSVYRTGSTKPPKNYGGIVAFLLILVILLGSTVTVMGILNIQLFRALRSKDEETIAPVAFYAPELTEHATVEPLGEAGFWGMNGETVTAFYEQYYQIPRGVYITHITPDSLAYIQGIRVGDILLHIDCEPVLGVDELQELLARYEPGQTLVVELYRDGAHIKLELTAEDTPWN